MKKNNYTVIHIIQFFEPNQGYEEDLLSIYQAKEGNKVFILTSSILPGREGRSFKSRIQWPRIEINNQRYIIRLPAILLPSKASFLIGASFFLIFKKFDYLHIHGLLNPLGFIYTLITNFKKGKVITDNHDFVYSTHQLAYSGNNIYKKIRKLEFEIFRRFTGIFQLLLSDSVIGYEKVCKDFLIDFYKYKGKINQFTIGYDSNIFYPDCKSTSSKQKINLGFVGQLSKRKRPDLLLRILSNLPCNYNLIIIGSWDKKCLQEFNLLIKYYGLIDQVNIMGGILYKDLPKYINKLDLGIYLNSSSISCQQILGCGIPLLINNNQQFASSADFYGSALNFKNEKDMINNSTNWILKDLKNYPKLNRDSALHSIIIENLSFNKTYIDLKKYIYC